MAVSPSKVTVETNQLIRFLAHGRNSAGDSVGASIEWTATGGTILPDGRFMAAATGTFLIIGRSPQRDEDRVDTAVVKVVRRQFRLASLEIAPGNTTLAPGLSQTFLVTGYLQSGHAVPIGATWSATGGTVDAGGNYVAGDSAGTYQVIATHTVLRLADTAVVTITAPAPPPPPPPAVPPTLPPAPVLVSMTLVPGSATLAPFATRKFVAFGRTAAGDSVPLSPSFTPTGGTVTVGGVYSAGSTAGAFRLIASSGSLADTSTVVVTAPLGSGPPAGSGSGIPLGLAGLVSAGIDAGPYNLSLDSYHAGNIVGRLAAARAKGLRLMTNMTGGNHANYKTDGAFDMAKWRAKMDTYNTPAIKAAVAQAVADGTLLGNSVMDEPGNVSGASSWGPVGTMNKARVDSMAAYARAILPTLPMGVALDYRIWPDQRFRELDFLASQYRLSKGPVKAYRDGARALGARDGHQIVFSLNILDGGKPGLPCLIPATGGPGTYSQNCRMTPAQIREFGLALGPESCALLMWRYDRAYFFDPENQSALRTITDSLAKLPRKGCTRP